MSRQNVKHPAGRRQGGHESLAHLGENPLDGKQLFQLVGHHYQPGLAERGELARCGSGQPLLHGKRGLGRGLPQLGGQRFGIVLQRRQFRQGGGRKHRRRQRAQRVGPGLGGAKDATAHQGDIADHAGQRKIGQQAGAHQARFAGARGADQQHENAISASDHAVSIPSLRQAATT